MPRREELPARLITGTTRRAPLVQRDLLPVSDLRTAHWKADWRRVEEAMDGLAALPPVDLFKVKDDYFIIDGHKRVAAARRVGAYVDANVVELTPRPARASERGDRRSASRPGLGTCLASRE